MKKLKELMKKLKEMKTSKKIAVIVSAVLLVAVVITAIVLLTTCGNDSGTTSGGEEQTTGADNSSNAEKGTYTVSIKTAGGMVMSDIDVYVYSDDTLADLKDYKSTDESGIASFSLPKAEDYAITLASVPKGYNVEASYSFSGNTAVITLTSSLITSGDLSTATLALGDVMYDFTVKTPDGEEITLSELLEEKDLVMLNFWYTTCQYCVEEFPYMEEAYQQYKDDIAIVALNPMNDSAAIKTFQESYGLSFYMAECPTSWANTFGISGYPTSVFVDRYGVICTLEAGGILSKRPFVCAYEHFIGDDYEQKLCVNGISDLVTNVKPTFTMDTSENIGALINKGDIKVTYRPETEGDSAEYSWPFIAGEKNGDKCIYASNKGIEESYAILYADIELKAGQAIGFDYLVSSEKINDVLHVIVNDEPIYTISGVDEVEKWKSAYPCVATTDGTYEVAFCYIKDDSTNEGDDTVYLKNIRVVDASEIDAATYIPREVATSVDGFEYTYADIVYNEKDGYYHVGTANGPLLLADLMNYTQFNEEETVFDLIQDGDLVIDGVNMYDALVDYCSYASNSSLSGICTVNKELAELLQKLASVAGFEDNDNEWLKLCKYYQAYGTNGEQLVDPIAGLTTFSAYKATLGKNVSTNIFYYDRAIIPRGLFAEFIPDKSGVYRITSHSESTNGIDGWIFNENREELLVYEYCERMYEEDDNVSMVYYMEAGKKYYINIAYWDLYEVGTIEYDVEYVAAEYDYFRTCSPGFFTYDSNATGDEMYHVISGGIDVVLGTDGRYYEDLGKDANGKQKYGSLIYADFSGTTGVFSSSIVNELIAQGAFDFSKTENDSFIVHQLKQHNNDVEATKEYLKEYWGEDYDAYAEEYQLDDVFAGRFHGDGEDLTDEIKTYIAQMDKSGSEKDGCVVVTERLAEILQLLMDKFTFEDVDNSWLKLCYYYDHIGPEAN